MKCRVKYFGDDDNRLVIYNFHVIDDLPLIFVPAIGLGILFDNDWCPHNQTEEVEVLYDEKWINVLDHPDMMEVNNEVFSVEDIVEIPYDDD